MDNKALADLLFNSNSTEKILDTKSNTHSKKAKSKDYGYGKRINNIQEFRNIIKNEDEIEIMKVLIYEDLLVDINNKNMDKEDIVEHLNRVLKFNKRIAALMDNWAPVKDKKEKITEA